MHVLATYTKTTTKQSKVFTWFTQKGPPKQEVQFWGPLGFIENTKFKAQWLCLITYKFAILGPRACSKAHWKSPKSMLNGWSISLWCWNSSPINSPSKTCIYYRAIRRFLMTNKIVFLLYSYTTYKDLRGHSQNGWRQIFWWSNNTE